MVEGVKIDQLKGSNKPELVKLFTQTFREFPFIPIHRFIPESKPESEEALLKLGETWLKISVDFCMSMKSCWAYGIRKEDRLVSAFLSMDSTEKLSSMRPMQSITLLIMFNIYLFRLARVVGRRTARDIGSFLQRAFYKEKPKYEDRYIELVLLGTLPAYQRQGFGREMLHILYNKAKREKFRGVTLVVNRDTPAFGLYLREGFIVDKEFTLGDVTACWMRLVF